MTTFELLQLDFREEENKEILMRALKMIPPLKKYDVINLSHIQKAIHVMTSKYNMHLRINLDNMSNSKYDVWGCMIYSDKDLHLVDRVFSMCVEEMLIKVAIRLYAEVKRLKGKGH